MTDLETMHAYAGDADHADYMLYLPNGSIDDTERFLRWAVAQWEKGTPQSYEFAVTLEGGTHIGAVSVAVEDGQIGEMGWIIHNDYKGKGFITEAAQSVMNFAFSQLKLQKVFATCDYRHGASIRIMEKLGMTLERDDLTRRYKDSDVDVQELMYSVSRRNA